MGDQRNGGIAWTDHSWNPVRGCSRVNASCVNCYAETMAMRFYGSGMPYEELVRISKKTKKPLGWSGDVRLVPERLGDPLRWQRPRRIFVNSMSDLFHEKLPDKTIDLIFGVMAGAPRHTFQVLTKRPERMSKYMRARASLSNVWLGASVGCQSEADEFIPFLLDTPAAVRWVSYEPAHGAIDFTNIACVREEDEPDTFNPLRDGSPRRYGSDPSKRINWIVCGGESGPRARPFDLAWARSTIAQCRQAKVPVFVKQLGSNPFSMLDRDTCQPVRYHDSAGAEPNEWPEDLRVQEFPT